MSNNQVAFQTPKMDLHTFHCPTCFAYSKQRWGFPNVNYGGVTIQPNRELALTRCDNCENISIWVNEILVFPISISAVSPNPDLSDDVKRDFDEARNIVNQSPRGAAALLRLSVQKICAELGEKGKNINDDIAALVQKGLPVKIQQALDVVRVVGNNAVHPGSLDMRDDIEIAHQLFALVNLIAEVMISQPKHVESMFESMVPQGAKDAIEKRDCT
jgi:hypothetical protein